MPLPSNILVSWNVFPLSVLVDIAIDLLVETHEIIRNIIINNTGAINFLIINNTLNLFKN